MIGVFDSGVGGMTALTELRRLLPSIDVTYLADRKNAPYGTKSKAHILSSAEACIRQLTDLGAERILIACCTASTLFSEMSAEARAVAVPIIRPTAEAAAIATHNGRIAVIATKATVRTHAFSREISAFSKVKVLELEAQSLVGIVEDGARDGKPLSQDNARTLDEILEPIKAFGADTLILGCTHFPHLTEHIQKRLPDLTLISPSREGALEIARITENRGGGSTVFI